VSQFLRVAALAVALGLCIALPAHAQVKRQTFPLYTGAAGDTTAVGMADSTAWKPTASFQRMYLRLKPSRPCRVAIAVYEAAANDTASAFLSVPDTVNVMVWPWRGGSPVLAGADSLAFRETISPTSVTAGSYEMIYEFPADAAGKWQSPRGRIIALHSPATGEWFTGQFTRIRLRVLSASGVVTWSGQLKTWAW